MYASALSTLRYNIAHYVIVVVVVVMLELMMQATGIVTLVFAGLTMLYTHRMIQLNEIYGWSDPLGTTGRDGSKIPIVGYLLRFLALFVVLTLLMTAGFIMLEATGVLNPNAFMADIEFAMWGIMIGVPMFCILMALLGTVLPACAERADTSPVTAISRGGKTFGKTLLHLLIGPVFVGVGGMVVLGFTGWHVDGSGTWVMRALYQTVVTVMTIVPAMLAATALSLAYLDAESR